MADDDSTAPITTQLDAIDRLDEAVAIARFVQGVSLSPRGGELHLTAGQLSGLYYVMQDLINRITSAKQLVEGVRHG